MSTQTISAKQHKAEIYITNPSRRDFHIDDFEAKVGCTEDEAKDLLRWFKDYGSCSLCPVYRRKGWWTTAPTHEVWLEAHYEASYRNETEHERTAQHLHRHRADQHVEGLASSLAGAIQGHRLKLEQYLPYPDRTNDHCLNRIDSLILAGQLDG